jgi:ketosteroid isomerase-like protein
MTDLCENWDFADVRQSAMWVEGDTAIVKRGGPIRHRPSGQVIDTSFIEIMTVKNGKISAFEQYVDTQLIAHTLEKAAAAR